MEVFMSDVLGGYEVAVLLPCYNEALTIAEVVQGFKTALPGAKIYVYDNNSSDLTALRARIAGAEVVREPRQGKGNVVRRMFSDIEADIYIMADGDGTYAPEDAPELLRTLLSERSDMVVGVRRGVTDDAGRKGHAFGNKIFNTLFQTLFGNDFTDIFSGYRAFSRRYVKSFPAVSKGFEIETEMSVHASQLKLPVCEIELEYGRRPEGSHSKLSTFKDGFRILKMFLSLMKETQPLRLFGAFAAFCILVGIGLAMPVVFEFMATGQVRRLPSWNLGIAMFNIAVLSFFTGLILDSISKGRAELKRVCYLGVPSRLDQRNAQSNSPYNRRVGMTKSVKNAA
jgi:glycosyltransferase involved in cell wall biosynthesis